MTRAQSPFDIIGASLDDWTAVLEAMKADQSIAEALLPRLRELDLGPMDWQRLMLIARTFKLLSWKAGEAAPEGPR